MDTVNPVETSGTEKLNSLEEEVRKLQSSLESLISKLYQYNDRIEDLEAKLSESDAKEEESTAILHEAVYRVTATAKQDAEKFGNIVNFYRGALRDIIENFTYPLLREILNRVDISNPSELAGAISKSMSKLNNPPELAVVEDIQGRETPEEAPEEPGVE